MEIMEFCEKVGKSLAFRMGDTATVSTEKVLKNNGVTLHGVSVMEKGCNIAANIYLDDLYLQYIQGRQLGGIVEEVYRGWQENRRQEKVDMGFFPDYGQVKNRVCYKVIGLENNRELLEQVPHVPFLDMAAVFYCDAPELETDMAATVLIRNRHMEMWGGVTAGEMYREAGRNTPRIRPPKLQDIREVMHDMGRTPLPDGAPVIYVLGNGNRMFGAAVILYSENANESGNVVMSLQTTSAALPYLKRLAINREETDILISDANTDTAETISGSRCRVTKIPDGKKEKAAGSVDVTIFVPKLEYR